VPTADKSAFVILAVTNVNARISNNIVDRFITCYPPKGIQRKVQA
jgi:hypothetical protein